MQQLTDYEHDLFSIMNMTCFHYIFERALDLKYVCFAAFFDYTIHDALFRQGRQTCHYEVYSSECFLSL